MSVMPHTKPVLDDRTPNQIRLDRMIDYNKETVELLDQLVLETEKLNKNLAVVGQALLKMLEPKVDYDPSFAIDNVKINQQAVKKSVDKPVKVK